MKWPAILLFLAAAFPLSVWLRRNPWMTSKVWMLVGFLPFAIYGFHLYMAVVSWSDWPVKDVVSSFGDTEWPGYVKGIEISALDVLALALFLSLPATRNPLPFKISMALYFAAAALSTLQAAEPIAALFYLWQLARMFLVYAVVAKASCSDPRVIPALLKGMAAGLFMEVAFELWQRFGLGIDRTYGTFSHENLLGMMSHFVVFPYLALLFAGPSLWLPAAVTAAGAIAELLTVSRATVGIAVLGYGTVFVLSALRRWSPRKGLFLAIGVFMLATATPFAVSSFDYRFAGPEIVNSEFLGYDERAAFTRAAEMMLSEHPWGVGVNHYVLVANNGGYNRWAGVAPVPTSLLLDVHNVYLLVAAESGYLGLITFIFLLLRPMTVAFLCSWRNQGDVRGDLLMGLGVALLAVYIHSFWEFIFLGFDAQYMFAINMGLIAGLAEQLGYFKRRTSEERRSRLGAWPVSSTGMARRSSRGI
jgi:O-antigen ligase